LILLLGFQEIFLLSNYQKWHLLSIFVVHGYHAYKDIWAAEIRSELLCFIEPHNREDRYAVAVMDGTSIVGHVPRKISYICYIFLFHSGSIICHVTGPKQHSQDLEQGGLDVPCEYKFYSKDKRVKVTKKLLELASFSTKDIVEVKASATAPPTSSKDTSKDTTKSYARVEVSSTCSATSHLYTQLLAPLLVTQPQPAQLLNPLSVPLSVAHLLILLLA